jgi:hypothetical protein
MDKVSDPPLHDAESSTNASFTLVQAQAQIDELLELNKRLRAELGQMTVMWVDALGTSRKPVKAVQKAVAVLRHAFGGSELRPRNPVPRSVREYQMLGALSALQQGRHSGLVIPTVELLALGYAVETHGSFGITPAGEAVLAELRTRLLNTGQHPVLLAK